VPLFRDFPTLPRKLERSFKLMRVLLFRAGLPSTLAIALLVSAVLFSGCSTAEKAAAAGGAASRTTKEKPAGPLIEIDKDGPADTVRAFYKLLKEKRFKEAIFLTNLRPAIEGLTDSELKEFSLDFEALAGQIPADVEISGEIVSGDKASVTVNLPKDETGKKETQKIDLTRSGDYWVIQTVDEAAAQQVKAQGKDYFYNLRIDTHQDEAYKMLNRIRKAQLVYSASNGGTPADIPALVAAELLPADITSSSSTGYNYSISLSSDKKTYTATATPADYGRSGKLSFLLDSKGITSKDLGGKPLTK
jgi:hypothetical protein